MINGDIVSLDALRQYINARSKIFNNTGLLWILLGLIEGLDNYEIRIPECIENIESNEKALISFSVIEKNHGINKLCDALKETNLAYSRIILNTKSVEFKYKLDKSGNDYIAITEQELIVTGYEKSTVRCYRNAGRTFIIYSLQDIYKSGNNMRVKSGFYPTEIPSFVFPELTIGLLNVLSQKYPFFKDILADFVATGFVPKRTLKDCFKFTSRQELLQSFRKYKKLAIPKRINKVPLKEAILLCDIALLLSQRDQQRLFNMELRLIKKAIEDTKKYPDYAERRDDLSTFGVEYSVLNFFELLWSENGMEKLPKNIFEDYFRLKKTFKEPISLNKKSSRKIREEHDALALKYASKKMKKLTIPKNSKFNALKLPAEYERITTKKRLLQEGMWQRHCVVSYDKFINADKCAIYSKVYNGIRYTIEIRIERNKYKCRQIKGALNSDPPKEFKKEVADLLAKSKPIS
ncbi:MAG: PcfJ domain-containing protein [Defluviitaleaceae bacterium]|nr:PcfJ domain-containing protein [Defluviitaleaceae bacterium]